jgi:CRP/FNR family transcriptional regulator
MEPSPVATDLALARFPGWAERRTTGIEGLLHGLDDGVRARVLDLTRQRRRVPKGDALYLAGSAVSALFAVHVGSVKSLVGLPDGRRQLVGFHIVGDIVGLAGLANGQHADDAIASEPVEVALLPYLDLARLARDVPQLHSNLTRLLGVTSARGRQAVVGLASDNARARVAGFLLVLADRFARRGQPFGTYTMPLTNQELGSLLGLTPETISRTMSAMLREGLLQREGRRIELVDVPALRGIAAQTMISGTIPAATDAREDEGR